MNDWGIFTVNRFQILKERYEFLPSNETIIDNKNQIVVNFARLKIFLAILFIMGDKNSAILLMIFAVLRILFYYNPYFFPEGCEEQPAKPEFKDESDPLTEGPIFFKA